MCFTNKFNIHAAKAEQPIQVFGCSYTSRDLSIYKSQREPDRKKEYQETLDQIATGSDLGLHICKVVDPDSGNRYVVAFAGTGYQGHMAISIVEEK